MKTNVELARDLIDNLLDRMADHEFFALGGDVIVRDKNGVIHLLFDAGDTDVAITFRVSAIRSEVQS